MDKILCVLQTFDKKNLEKLNREKINGVPLFIFKYFELKKSRYYDNLNIILASDNIKTTSELFKYDIKIPFILPPKISNNCIKILKYIKDWYKENSQEKFSGIILLPANYLNVKIEDIDNCIDLFIKSKKNIVTFNKINLQNLNFYKIENDICKTLDLINLKKDIFYQNDAIIIKNTNNSQENINYIIKNNILHLNNYNDFLKNKKDIYKQFNIYDDYVMIKVLDIIHPENKRGFFGFDCVILDKYLKSSNWNEGIIFKCYREKTNENFNVIIWRKKISFRSTAHGRNKDKEKIINFNPNEKLFLKYNDNRLLNILKKYKDKNIFNQDVLHLFENKKIIICGNGINGYELNKSNKYVDNHDIVIRLNSYRLVENLNGEKTTIHFMNSTNKNIHCKEDPIYPTINQSKFILINDDNIFFKNLKSLKKKLKGPFIKYNTKLIDNILFEIFKNKVRMTGPIIMIILILVRLKCNCKINYIGFSDGHKLIDNKQDYYWGKRHVKNNEQIKFHNAHSFDKQYKLLNILDFLL